MLNYGKGYFINLAGAEDIKIIKDKSTLGGEDNVSVVLDKCEIYIPLKELIDFDKEIERLEKEKKS